MCIALILELIHSAGILVSQYLHLVTVCAENLKTVLSNSSLMTRMTFL